MNLRALLNAGTTKLRPAAFAAGSALVEMGLTHARAEHATIEQETADLRAEIEVLRAERDAPAAAAPVDVTEDILIGEREEYLGGTAKGSPFVYGALRAERCHRKHEHCGGFKVVISDADPVGEWHTDVDGVTWLRSRLAYLVTPDQVDKSTERPAVVTDAYAAAEPESEPGE